MTERREQNLHIRRMHEEDIPEVVKLGRVTEGFEVGEDSGFWDAKTLRRWLTTSDDPLLIAKQGNKLAGFILGAVHHPTQKVTLENIVVDPTLRGQRIAEKLLTSFMDELKKQDALYVCALSKTTNTPAINFFLKNEFKRGHDFAWLYKNSYPQGNG